VRRRLIALTALLSGALAGVAILRRTSGRRRDRVDLYFDDGSLVTLSDLEAAPLLEIARTAL
jgi:hypothetical protein